MSRPVVQRVVTTVTRQRTLPAVYQQLRSFHRHAAVKAATPSSPSTTATDTQTSTSTDGSKTNLPLGAGPWIPTHPASDGGPESPLLRIPMVPIVVTFMIGLSIYALWPPPRIAAKKH